MHKIGDILEMTISNIKYSRGEGGEYETVPTGTYSATLTEVTETEITDFDDKTKTHMGVMFRFLVNGPTGEVQVIQSCKASVHPLSNLYKFLQGMDATTLHKVQQSDDGVSGLINGLVGNDYLVSVELKTSGTGREYNKIMSVNAPPKEYAKKKVTKEEVDKDLDDLPGWLDEANV